MWKKYPTLKCYGNMSFCFALEIWRQRIDRQLKKKRGLLLFIINRLAGFGNYIIAKPEMTRDRTRGSHEPLHTVYSFLTRARQCYLEQIGAVVFQGRSRCLTEVRGFTQRWLNVAPTLIGVGATFSHRRASYWFETAILQEVVDLVPG